jgi:hypothetical protein
LAGIILGPGIGSTVSGESNFCQVHVAVRQHVERADVVVAGRPPPPCSTPLKPPRCYPCRPPITGFTLARRRTKIVCPERTGD